MEEPIIDIRVGKVTHYYNRISVAVLDLTDELKVGDRICIVGRFTDIEQRVGSMEINHEKVTFIGPGTEVALKVYEPVRKGDVVYKVVEGE
jgi:U32 family peptidase